MRLAVAIALTALYVARDVLLPLALAAMLAFLLTPIVRRLERYRIRRVPAVLLTVLVVASAVALVCYGAAEQILELTARLPEYRQNIDRKIGSANRLVQSPSLERNLASPMPWQKAMQFRKRK